MRTFPLPAALLAAVLLLAGCSSTGTGASGDAPAADGAASVPAGADEETGDEEVVIPDDPCSLITVEEATEAYGGEITTTDPGSSGCVYSGPSTGFITQISSIGGDDGWTIALAGLKAQTGSTPEVTGVGDRAAGTEGTIVVQQGGTIFSISASYASQDPDAAKAAAVAKVIATRL